MRRLLTALLTLALLLMPALARAQIWTPQGDKWMSEIQDLAVIGSYGILVVNEGTTGTTNTLLACYATGGLAITCPTSTTLEVLGPVLKDGGTTGSAVIASSGIAAGCQFDGATTAGNYVQRSLTVTGNCTDAGASYPSNGRRIVGTVLTTNGASGVYPVFMYGRGIQAPPTDVRTCTADCTWTKPFGVTASYVFLCGSGGGGGGGQGAAAPGLRSGGGGGGGGFCRGAMFRSSILGATETVTVPAGGTGGTGGTSAGGADAGSGAQAQFGSWLKADGGGGGAGNTAGAAGGSGAGCTTGGTGATATSGVAGGNCFVAGPIAGTVSQDGSVGASSAGVGASGVSGNGSSYGGGSGAGSSTNASGISGLTGGASLVSGGGGGAGGGVTAASPGAESGGAQGGNSGYGAGPGGTAGTSGGACGGGTGDGGVGPAADAAHGGGGGGGGASKNAATGCAGGAGGIGGGGGGGGAGGTTTGGSGGNGGSAWAVMISW